MNRVHFFKTICAVALISQTAFAAGPGEQCGDLFTSETQYALEMKNLQDSKLNQFAPTAPVSAFDDYRKLVRRDARFAKLFPQREVLRILGTEEMPYFSRMLQDVLKTTRERTRFSIRPPSAIVRDVLRKQLVNQVPNHSIDERISAFVRGDVPVERVLGDMTLTETHELFHGGNPLKPTPESLVGQYLAETGAATIARTYNQIATVPQGESQQGAERLTIAVSAETFPIYQKYFNRTDLLTVIGHAQVVQGGKIVSYSTNLYEPLRVMSERSVMPALILKTTEAQRTEFFLKVIANRGENYSWSADVMSPWKIKKYCGTKGGYETCTHWIGNMPIGDERVNAYVFPGAIDEHAQNQRAPRGTTKRMPRVGVLRPHSHENPHVQKAFQAPGYAQFTDVIGLEDSNRWGQWANPGWLITSLLGQAEVDHVPFVFVWATDAKAALTKDFIPKYETPL